MLCWECVHKTASNGEKNLIEIKIREKEKL